MKHSIPKIAIVGRPNVGKSALFNRLCSQRLSIVDEEEGITRDRLYAEADFFGQKFCLIDTGGIDPGAKLPFNELVLRQSEMAIAEADAAVLVVDSQVGPTLIDHEVAKLLLHSGKPVIVAVNKIDDRLDEGQIHQFHSLSFQRILAVSAVQGFRIAELMEEICSLFPVESEEAPAEISTPPFQGIRVAIAGRPNVGKSTLLNRLLGQDRAIVSPIAGTTRDAIDHPLTVDGQDYLLIDTAGIRRKCREHATVDKFAAIRTKEAIERSDVVLLILDAREGLTTQEKHIASDIEELGKSCVLIFNKWDLVEGFRMEHVLRAVREQVPFLAHCPALFLSAFQGRNTEKILPSVREVYTDRYQRITTGILNKFIEKCVQKYHPPMITGKRLRIYYMTQVQIAPPRFVFFVNRPELMTPHYLKYLTNQFREAFRFSGCPLFFDMRGKREEAYMVDRSAVEPISVS
ncbi:MAG: engA [Parachlamydiales bacterium]|nr:engA [Parachlamydiales bacterium]